MKLPWYVALDRWVRRNPTTAQTLKGIGALAIILVMVMSFEHESPAMGLFMVVLYLSFYMALTWNVRSTLEHYADKWREEH